MSSSEPTSSAPAAFAASARSPVAKKYAGRFPGAVGQIDRAADHLIRLPRIDAEPYGNIHGLVELCPRICLGERHRVRRCVRLPESRFSATAAYDLLRFIMLVLSVNISWGQLWFRAAPALPRVLLSQRR